MAEVKMKKKVWETLSLDIPLTDGVSASCENFTLKVTGPKGEVSKFMKYPNVEVKVEGTNVVILTKKLSKSEKKIPPHAIIKTELTIVLNLNSALFTRVKK